MFQAVRCYDIANTWHTHIAYVHACLSNMPIGKSDTYLLEDQQQKSETDLYRRCAVCPHED